MGDQVHKLELRHAGILLTENGWRHRASIGAADLAATGLLQNARRGWCQTDANQSQFFKNYTLLGRKKAAPLCESDGAIGLEILSA
jgi:hypothetical protein